MYKKRGASLSLKDVLAKLEGKTLPVAAYKPIVYSTSDILSAKTVLERLLAGFAESTPSCNEVSYTRVIVTVDRET